MDGRPSPTRLGVGQGTARLDDIDPSNIARVDVITGPTAAVYGPGAANGVILVTTTQSNGGRPRVDLSAEGGLTTTPLRDGQSYYAWGSGARCLTYVRAQGLCAVDSITHFNPLLANGSSVTRTGYLQRYVASVGGGLAGDVLRYMVTGNYSDEAGTLWLPTAEQQYYQNEYHATVPPAVVRPNAMDAAGVRGTMVGTFGSVADVTASLGHLGNHQRSTDDGRLLQEAAFTPGYQNGDGWGTSQVHPADIFAERGGDKVDRLTGSLHGDWRPVSMLRVFATAGADNVDETKSSYYAALPSSSPFVYTSKANDRQRTNQATVSGGLTISGALAPGVSTQATVGGEWLGEHYLLDNRAVAFVPGIGNIATSTADFHVRSQTTSGYVEDAVTIVDRVFVSGGVRVDDVRIHPLLANTAVNGFVNAAVVPLPTVAPALRLHGGYSTSNQTPTAQQALANVFYVLTYTVGGSYPTFVRFGPGPTREQDVEAGVSAGAWHGRLSGDVTVYDRRTARALVPSEFFDGYTDVRLVTNDGVVQNRGIEGRISAQLIEQPAFGWDVTLTAFGNRNTVAKASTGPAGPGLQVANGFPVYGVWGYRYTYADANGDGAIGPNEVHFTSPHYVGSAVPTREASVATGVRLFRRRLRLAALVDYRGGYVLPDLAGMYRAVAQYDPAMNNVPASLARQAQAIAALDGGPNTNGWYQQVEAFRWRELSATVTVRRFDVTLAARNLALWTNYRGNDPDVDLTEGGGTYATTLRLPPPRTFLIKVATTI